MDVIQQNWPALQERIARAASAAGRAPQEIAVVAVAKTRTPQEVEAAIRSGLGLIGENRVQEAEAKKNQVRSPAQWHLIGHLQTNKAARAVDLFDMIQSVDSARLALALEQRAARSARRLDILVQVNTSGAAQQSGVAPQELPALVEQLAALPHLRLRGLMTIGALSPQEAVVRGCFARLRELRDQLAARFGSVELDCLSMGMSGDFELAIAEGATMLRLGSALFGRR